jgi:hypothetical protein
VFNLKDPIYLIAVACTGEPVTHLFSQLEYTYAHIISILTNHSITRIRNKPKFDLRNLLGGIISHPPSPSLFYPLLSHR